MEGPAVKSMGASGRSVTGSEEKLEQSHSKRSVDHADWSFNDLEGVRQPGSFDCSNLRLSLSEEEKQED